MKILSRLGLIRDGLVTFRTCLIFLFVMVPVSFWIFPVGAQSPPTPKGVVVRMSDGTTQDFPLGIYLLFQNSTLRGIFPTQYVNQPANRQPFTSNDDVTWKLNRPGRNIQVWRNGLHQAPYTGYTILCAQPYKRFTLVQDAVGNWSTKYDNTVPEITTIPMGDYTMVGDLIKPRFKDGAGRPYFDCDGNIFGRGWDPNDLILTAYLY